VGRAVLACVLLLQASPIRATVLADHSAPPRVTSVTPVDGARYVRPETSILVRFDRAPEFRDAGLAHLLTATGSASGAHAGRAHLTRDGRALVFDPQEPFALGERVTVTLGSPATGDAGAPGASGVYTFQVCATRPEPAALPEEFATPATPAWAPLAGGPVTHDSLPGDFPPLNVMQAGRPAPGVLFTSNLESGDTYSPYLIILGNDGTPVWYQEVGTTCTDFKMHENGRYSYFDGAVGHFVVLDETMNPVDQWECRNGYTTDLHELRLLPNGHALMMSYDPQVVDMSLVVPGGKTNALVTGLIIQEQDADKNVVFQWRSWDHFQITDCTHQDLTRPLVDYVHGNAIEVDGDGNLLISSRHLSEITKIDHETGDILWRWGGVHNEFTFVGDTLQFTYQHAIRRLANGHYTLFDNGNFHSPPFSRACEYELDEANRTATLVWSFRNTPDSYGNAMGYVQRLANGNTLVSFGTGKPDAIEVTPEGDKVLVLALPAGISSYRTFRFDGPPELLGVGIASGTPPDLAFLGRNPVRGPTTMLARLPAAGVVSVTVLDVQGRVVATPLPPAWHSAGVLSVPVSLAGRANGVYFCRLQAGGKSRVRRIVLVE
jgi:hypothetical protein